MLLFGSIYLKLCRIKVKQKCYINTDTETVSTVVSWGVVLKYFIYIYQFKTEVT